MLLFIGWTSHLPFAAWRFQYIPCYCLSWALDKSFFDTKLFQYIPCYCLSFLYRFYSVLFQHFNTSHVTVYRGKPCGAINLLQFQYIPCYCLSNLRTRLSPLPYNFNTSHVTVYLLHLPQYYRLSNHFNTSHVTVYRIFRSCGRR